MCILTHTNTSAYLKKSETCSSSIKHFIMTPHHNDDFHNMTFKCNMNIFLNTKCQQGSKGTKSLLIIQHYKILPEHRQVTEAKSLAKRFSNQEK